MSAGELVTGSWWLIAYVTGYYKPFANELTLSPPQNDCISEHPSVWLKQQQVQAVQDNSHVALLNAIPLTGAQAQAYMDWPEEEE